MTIASTELNVLICHNQSLKHSLNDVSNNHYALISFLNRYHIDYFVSPLKKYCKNIIIYSDCNGIERYVKSNPFVSLIPSYKDNFDYQTNVLANKSIYNKWVLVLDSSQPFLFDWEKFFLELKSDWKNFLLKSKNKKMAFIAKKSALLDLFKKTPKEFFNFNTLTSLIGKNHLKKWQVKEIKIKLNLLFKNSNTFYQRQFDILKNEKYYFNWIQENITSEIENQSSEIAKNASLFHSYLFGNNIIYGKVINSIIGRNVEVKKGAEIYNSIIMENNIINKKVIIRNSLIEAGKNDKQKRLIKEERVNSIGGYL